MYYFGIKYKTELENETDKDVRNGSGSVGESNAMEGTVLC